MSAAGIDTKIGEVDATLEFADGLVGQCRRELCAALVALHLQDAPSVLAGIIAALDNLGALDQRIETAREQVDLFDVHFEDAIAAEWCRANPEVPTAPKSRTRHLESAPTAAE